MKKIGRISSVFFVLLAACPPDDAGNVVVLGGEVSAQLSGDGMPADEPEKAYSHDEIWLEEPQETLSRFAVHQWNFEPGGRSYNLHLEFAPVDAPGSTELLKADVCVATCGKKPERDGCSGPCFSMLQSGMVDVVEVSDDGRSFDVRFEFEVADHEGRVIRVADGRAVTRDAAR
jgi:hypothetical protein